MSKEHGVFINRDLPSTSVGGEGQPRAIRVAYSTALTNNLKGGFSWLVLEVLLDGHWFLEGILLAPIKFI